MTTMTATVTRVNHSNIELHISADGLFRGLGGIRICGMPPRNGAVPLRFQFDTHDGAIRLNGG